MELKLKIALHVLHEFMFSDFHNVGTELHCSSHLQLLNVIFLPLHVEMFVLEMASATALSRIFVMLCCSIRLPISSCQCHCHVYTDIYAISSVNTSESISNHTSALIIMQCKETADAESIFCVVSAGYNKMFFFAVGIHWSTEHYHRFWGAELCQHFWLFSHFYRLVFMMVHWPTLQMWSYLHFVKPRTKKTSQNAFTLVFL